MPAGRCRAGATIRFCPARFSLIVVMLLGFSAPAAAGQIYDMGPLLDAPHPFEAPPVPVLKRPTQPGYTRRLYDMGPMLDEPHPFDVPAARQQYRQPSPSGPAGAPARPYGPTSRHFP